MKIDDHIKTSDVASSDILVVGDAAEAFIDFEQAGQDSYSQCANILDAIELASDQKFKIIFVVISKADIKLASALSALRRVSKGANIILLTPMYAEPVARKMIGRFSGHRAVADDYYICPVDIKSFRNGSSVGTSTKAQNSLIHDTYKDARIKELEILAKHDDLTGLKNRRYVREFLYQIINRSEMEHLRVTLLLFDIDDFKHYNDSYGHAVGDDVLRQAAVMISRCCRDHDVIGRIGGDEFAVVFWDRPDSTLSAAGTRSDSERRHAEIKHPRQVLFMAERFRKEISSTDLSLLGPRGRGKLTISGGLVSYPDDGTNVEELFIQADNAMLEAKRMGKNKILLVGQAD